MCTCIKKKKYFVIVEVLAFDLLNSKVTDYLQIQWVFRLTDTQPLQLLAFKKTEKYEQCLNFQHLAS